MELSGKNINTIIESIEKTDKYKKAAFETPCVSIVMPAYNSEKYIAKCLKSLLEQTLENIEIIIVNDGSTDDTQKIVEAYKQCDARIKLINQKHQRQGAARNAGTKTAKGEYIGYVDSDDWVDLDYFEKLYNAAKKYDCDIALATNVRIGNGKTKKRLNITQEKVAYSLEDMCELSKQAKNPCPTNKIYRRSMFLNNDILWPEGVYCEDKLFTIKTLYYAKNMVSVPGVYYYYFRNPDSTVNNKAFIHKNNIKSDKEQAKCEVLKFLKDKNAKIKDGVFWAISKEYKIFNLSVLTVKESMHTKKYYLFSIIKICEAKC